MAVDEAHKSVRRNHVDRVRLDADRFFGRHHPHRGGSLQQRRQAADVLRRQVDDDGFLTDSGTRFGEPVLTEPAPGTDAWAVQVASFSDSANAENFRTQLRDDGYEAFISTARRDGQVHSRVAVGPLLDAERAESLRGELSARYDVKARLMAFSN